MTALASQLEKHLAQTDQPDQSFWDDYAQCYKFLHESHIYRQLMFDSLELAKVSAGMRCLDLACGPGNYVVELVKTGSDVVAVDFSQRMVAIARNKVRNTQDLSDDGKISFKLADVLEFLESVPDGSFDVVIAALALSYFKDPAKVLSETYRILKPTGKLVMSNPVPHANFSKVFKDSIGDIIKNIWAFLPAAVNILKYAKKIERFQQQGKFHFFTIEETKGLLNKAGFKPENVTITDAFSKQVYLTRAEK